MNDHVELKRMFGFRRPAGLEKGDWRASEARREKYEKYYSHWYHEAPFKMVQVPKEEFRRCPTYTGNWNPVMWSDYPKQPAWTVPLPKLPGFSVTSCKHEAVARKTCWNPPMEYMSSKSFPFWIPEILPRMDAICSPFINEQQFPYRNNWKCSNCIRKPNKCQTQNRVDFCSL